MNACHMLLVAHRQSDLKSWCFSLGEIPVPCRARHKVSILPNKFYGVVPSAQAGLTAFFGISGASFLVEGMLGELLGRRECPNIFCEDPKVILTRWRLEPQSHNDVWMQQLAQIPGLGNLAKAVKTEPLKQKCLQ